MTPIKVPEEYRTLKSLNKKRMSPWCLIIKNTLDIENKKQTLKVARDINLFEE